MKHTGCLHFITLMNLLHLPTSVNCLQDIISHMQVVHRLQVKSMHSLQDTTIAMKKLQGKLQPDETDLDQMLASVIGKLQQISEQEFESIGVQEP